MVNWNRKSFLTVTISLYCLIISDVRAGGEGNSVSKQAGKVKISTGFDFSSGDYGGTQDTEIWYVPLTAAYTRQQWKAKITVPWLQITGPGVVTGGGDIINPGASGNAITTESGLGDVATSLTYAFDPLGPGLPFLDLTAKIKFPTANEDKGLGSGEFDYTVKADLFKPLGKAALMGTLGYKFKGEPPGRDVNNVLMASLGVNYKINNRYSTGGFVDFQEATSDSSQEVIDLFLYATWKLNKAISVTGYGAVGFTDSTPDEEIGLQIGYKR